MISDRDLLKLEFLVLTSERRSDHRDAVLAAAAHIPRSLRADSIPLGALRESQQQAYRRNGKKQQYDRERYLRRKRHRGQPMWGAGIAKVMA